MGKSEISFNFFLKNLDPFGSSISSSNNDKHVYVVLCISGVIGFILGVWGHTSLQDSVEMGQVVSGIVRYPQGHFIDLYSRNTWNLIVQLSALLLKCGLSEQNVSLFLSGLMTMVMFQAMSLCLLCFVRNKFLAICLPCFSYLTLSYNFGFTYPIIIMDSRFTLGIIGLGYFLLTLSLIGLGMFRVGYFLLGLAPTVHVSIGLWGCIGLMLSSIPDTRYFFMRREIRYFIAGFLLCVLSKLINIGFVEHAMGAKSLSNSALGVWTTFVTHWDVHRRPPDLTWFPIIFYLWAGFLYLFFGFTKRVALSKEIRLVLKFFIYTIFLSLSSALLFNIIPLNQFPREFIISMPMRIINLAMLGFFSVLLGFLSRFHQIFLNRLNFICIIFVLFLSILLKVSYQLRYELFILSISVLMGSMMYESKNKFRITQIESQPFLKEITRWIAVVLLSAAVLFSFIYSYQDSQNKKREAVSMSPVIEMASRRQGTIITGNQIRLVQLQTRRPIVIDMATLDWISYYPQISVPMTNVLKNIYGVDITQIYPNGRTFPGIVPAEITRELWEKRSIEDWMEIKKIYNASDILVLSQWKLKLPIVIHDENLTLYTIP